MSGGALGSKAAGPPLPTPHGEGAGLPLPPPPTGGWVEGGVLGVRLLPLGGRKRVDAPTVGPLRPVRCSQPHPMESRTCRGARRRALLERSPIARARLPPSAGGRCPSSVLDRPCALWADRVRAERAGIASRQHRTRAEAHRLARATSCGRRSGSAPFVGTVTSLRLGRLPPPSMVSGGTRV